MGSCVSAFIGTCFAQACCAGASSCGNMFSGRKRSVALLLVSIAAALAFQYGLAPFLSSSSLPFVDRLERGWDCGLTSSSSSSSSSILEERCRGNQGVYRVAASTVVTFALACSFGFRDVSFLFFFLLVVGSVFVPSVPIFRHVWLQLARVGGAVFILVQQLILIDVSYGLNERWVERANRAEAIEPKAGRKYLVAILVACGVMYVGSLAVLSVLFVYYSNPPTGDGGEGGDVDGGCPVNKALLSLTLILAATVTTLQLRFSDQSSLLTSAFITAYGTYLAATAVSKHPGESCNPGLRSDNRRLDAVVGLALALGSTVWAGWSQTAPERLGGANASGSGAADEETIASPAPVQGIVVGVVPPRNDESYQATAATATATDAQEGKDNDNPSLETTPTMMTTTTATATTTSTTPGSTESVVEPTRRINLVLILVTCWYSMSLTGWGSIQAGGDIANPTVHFVSLWMIVASQWLMFLLYGWTLIAPTLFPDRDFD